MNRLRNYALPLGAALLWLSQGCGGASQTPSAEPTAGGEARPGDQADLASGQPLDNGDDAFDAATQSPWGATQAEQCVRPPRTPMESRAQKEFTRGVQALRDDEIDIARESFEKAADKDSNAYAALYNLGVLADREGND